MNSRAVTMMVASIVLGLAAVLVAARWVSGQSAGASVKVVVASKDLPLGTRLAGDQLLVVDWPQSSALNGSFSDPRMLETRVINTSVQRGVPIVEAKLAPAGAKGGLSAVISEGKRAMTVKVNEVVGVAGFALPGSVVDIVLNTQDQNSVPISKIVLEQILVLAIAQEAGRDDTKPKVVSAVTLEVTPAQAEKLDLGRSVGTLSLVLRNQIDRNAVATPGTRKLDLLGLSETPGPSQIGRTGKSARSAGANQASKLAGAGGVGGAEGADGAGHSADGKHQQTIEVIRGVARGSVQVSVLE